MGLTHSFSLMRALLLAVLVAAADASLGADSALAPGGSLAQPKAPEPRTLENDLFACRVACHAETWDPVCVGGTMTYANACWTRCASSLSRSDAETLPVTPGKCENERNPEPSCLSSCVNAWGDENDGSAAFGWRPVCGEDGVTYTTACFARCSGVMSGEGECHDVDPRRRR